MGVEQRDGGGEERRSTGVSAGEVCAQTELKTANTLVGASIDNVGRRGAHDEGVHRRRLWKAR